MLMVTMVAMATFATMAAGFFYIQPYRVEAPTSYFTNSYFNVTPGHSYMEYVTSTTSGETGRFTQVDIPVDGSSGLIVACNVGYTVSLIDMSTLSKGQLKKLP